jgi:hypothetical protein
MSAQSCSRLAKALCTTRSSAEQVVIFISDLICQSDERSIVRASNGNPPKAMSIGTLFEAKSSRTRVFKANSAASCRRGRKCSVSSEMKRSSLPMPVNRVKSTSCVARGSPHRCNATAPMKQKRYCRNSQNRCSSNAASKTLLMGTRLLEDSLLLDQPRTGLALGAAPHELGRHIQRVERGDCIFVGHRTQLFAFYLAQRDRCCAPLVHPGALIFRSFGQMHYLVI